MQRKLFAGSGFAEEWHQHSTASEGATGLTRFVNASSRLLGISRMLKQEEVDAEEESLRRAIRELPDEQRAEFYRFAEKAVKDPDTYAAVNWFFIAGLHHFYLGRWQWGLMDLGALVVAVGCFATGLIWGGIALLVVTYSWELVQLFRSQIIVQDWNNRLYRKLLRRY